MKIGLISTPFLEVPPKGYGGLERIVWDLANGLIKLGEKVVIVACQGSRTPQGGFTIEAIPKSNIDSSWLEEERRMWKVYEPLITSADFDIIHGHNWFGFEYATKAKNVDIKTCHTHHGHLNLRWWGVTKPDFPLNMIAISDYMVEQFQLMSFPAKRVYNGVDMDLYPYSKDHGERLLFVGRIAEFKQPHVAIKAALKAGYKIDILGGTFVDNQRYVDEIIHLAKNDNVKLHLDAPHDLKVKLMQEAKALLFPSAMGEPFGLVMIEGLACGCPVIALDDGAVTELLTDKTGIVCRSKDTSDSIDLMAKAIADIDCKASDCRKRAEMFSVDVMAKNYLESYHQILQGNEW